MSLSKIATLLFSLIIIIQSNGQNLKDKFQKDVFEKELGYKSSKTQRHSHSSAFLYTSPQNLPNWCSQIPASSNREIFAIGISDPGMDTAQAMSMAIQRAEIMANLFRKSTVQLLCDFYVSDDDHIKKSIYEHGAQIYAYLPATKGTTEVLQEHFSEFHEAIVLIKYTPPRLVSKKKLSVIRAEVYRSDMERNKRGEFKTIYELILKNHFNLNQAPVFYEATEIGNHKEVLSIQENDTVFVPIYNLKYKADSSYSTLSHGLWSCYYKQTVDYILDRAREKPENIRYLGDDYMQSTIEKQVLGKSENLVKTTLRSISFSENALKVGIIEN
jgi:hypothetical protein